MKDKNFDEFFSGYLEAALFNSTDDDDRPLDHCFEVKDFSDDAKWVLEGHARSFWSRTWYFVEHEDGERSMKDLGYDFWMTQNGHGAGFWDGDWPVYGDMLTKLSKCYPEMTLTVEEGKLCVG